MSDLLDHRRLEAIQQQLECLAAQLAGSVMVAGEWVSISKVARNAAQVIATLQRERDEARSIIAASGCEKDELRAKAGAAEHRRAAAEYRAQRIVLDAELKAECATLRTRVEALERLPAKWRNTAGDYTERSRKANHAGNVEMDAYHDGKSMALKDVAHELEDALRRPSPPETQE